MTRSPETMSREELEEEVHYLRSELGLTTHDSAVGDVKRATGLSDAPARVFLALYQAKGRTLAKHHILDAVPAQRTNGDRDPKLADVWVCRIRSATFPAAIRTVWGRGHAITPEGAEIVARAIEGAGA